MGRVIFDIEADGLYNQVENVWCICTCNVDTGERGDYSGAAIKLGIEYLQQQQCLVGHNIIGYDLPVLWKLYGKWDRVPLIIDTLVTSRFFKPERKGGHSLGAWGETLGCSKIEFNDYSGFSDEMMVYCQQDVELNRRVLLALEDENEAPLSGYQVFR